MEKTVNQPISRTRAKFTMFQRAVSGLTANILGMHNAGKDLTEELEMAPHREENLKRVKLVGDLV